jgi:eukaryotic-like serine/threonine-protein kinase
MAGKTKRIYEFGPFQVDSQRRVLTRSGETIALTPKAFDTLLLLIQSSEKVVRKDDLMKALWPTSFVEEANLTQNIFTLRKALGERAHDHRYILTIPGEGYRFATKVIEISGDSLEPQEPETWSQHLRRSVREQLTASNTVVLMLIAISLLLIAAVLVDRSLSVRRLWNRSSRNDAGITSRVQARRSVAVLGFQNLSGREQEAWLSTALSEMLRTELAAGEKLRIISGEEVARAKQELSWKSAGSLSKDGMAKVTQDFGPDLIVVGSYTVIGDEGSLKLRLDARIQDTKSGEVIAEIAETGPETNLFDLVLRAGARLRQSLGIADLSPTEALLVRAALPSKPAAAQLYAEGLEKLRVFEALGARDRLRQAIAIDPAFPLAHSALADAWAALGYDRKAAAEATRAFQLSAGLSREDRLRVEGRYHIAMRNWSKAIDTYGMLTTLFPDNLDDGLRLAAAQVSASEGRNALSTLEALRRLSPPAGNDARIDLEAARSWNTLGEFRQMAMALSVAAEKAKAQGAQLLLARARNQQCWVFRFLAEQQQDFEACREARRIYAAAGDHGGEADTLRVFGDALSGSDSASAIKLYRRSLAIHRSIGHLSGEAIALNDLAVLFSHQGEHGAASELFQRSRKIFLQIDNKVNATGLLINIGYELACQAQLERSLKMYEEASRSAQALGNKDIEAGATYNTGLVRQAQGNLESAKKLFERSLDLFQQVNDRSRVAAAMYSLGEIATAAGDFAGARKLHQAAYEIQQAAKENLAAAESELGLANVSLEEGHTSNEIEVSIQRALKVFQDAKSFNDEAKAEASFARLLAAQGKPAEALKAARRASAVSPKSDPNYRLGIDVATARIRAATGDSRMISGQAATSLRRTLAEAHKFGFYGIELEAKLALGEIEVNSGNASSGRILLERVQREAQQRGFALIAAQAGNRVRPAFPDRRN